MLPNHHFKKIAVGAVAAVLGSLVIVCPAVLFLACGFGVLQVPDLDSTWPQQWSITASLPLWIKLLAPAAGLAALVCPVFFTAFRISGATTDREGLAITTIAAAVLGYQSRIAWEFGLSPILLLIYVIFALVGTSLAVRIRLIRAHALAIGETANE